MAYYGYIRVSTKGQVPGTSLAEQEQQIKERYPTAIIVKEAASGAHERQVFDNLCKSLQAGDTLVVCKMDRFCRSAKEGLQYVDLLRDKGVAVHIMNQKLGGTLNWEYVDSELQGLGIFSYERESRELAQKLFGSAELPTEANLSEAEQQMLAYYLGASTYGTIENRTLNKMRKLQPDGGAITARTKRKYLLSRIFPGREWCEAYAPTVYKYPVLLPFFWVWRLAVKGVKRRNIVKQELETIKRER